MPSNGMKMKDFLKKLELAFRGFARTIWRACSYSCNCCVSCATACGLLTVCDTSMAGELRGGNDLRYGQADDKDLSLWKKKILLEFCWFDESTLEPGGYLPAGTDYSDMKSRPSAKNIPVL